MVQLSSSPFGYQSPSGHSEEGREGNMKSAKPQVNHSQHGESQRAMSPLQSTLSSAASPSQAYETYIDNGLICLKHKIRNIEKKKLKLEDYKDRLKNGEQLNPDQLEAVEKYEEVLHNLEFAKELQKTFSGLSQDLLKAQKKAQRREHMLKLEAEKKKLRTILQVQYVLQNLTQEHVQKDFKGGLNGAVYLPLKELDYLIKFSKLTCPERNESLSVEDQMEQSSLYFWDLLEGSEKAVVGTTYKHMKDLLSKLLNSGYFESIPVPKNAKEKEVSLEEEMLIKSEKKKQLLKTESVKESESLMELAQPEIQPQEFLNRRYMTEVDYSSKQDEEQSWEADYARKPNLPKCWDMLTEPDGQEKKQESFKSWEPSVKHQEVSKPVVSLEQRKQDPKLRSTLQEEQKKQDVSKPKPASSQWKQETPKSKTGYIQEEQKKQETPKPWPVQLQKEQDPKKQSPKSWTPSVQNEQDITKSWTTPMCEDQDSRQPETPKSWENNVESQKHPLTPQSQISPKSWGVAPASLIPNDQLLPRKFNTEPKDVPKPMHQPVGSSSTLPKDPVLRKEKLQDLMTQIQGTCNFMQESILDFDKPSSAIPSSQPPSTTPGSPVASTEQNLSSQSDFLQEPLQAASSSVTCSSNACLVTTDQASSGSETEFMTSETPEVFNVNAPLPPRKEQEIKESPYSSGYNQSFTTASTQTPPQCQLPAIHVEQTVLSQETAASYPDGTIQVSNGSLAFYPAQTNVFPRPSQPFVNSRGSVRGCTRGGRLLTNTYRSPGGYKGFDTYRGPPSITNGNYSQLQFQAREYPGTPYSQRDNFQQCYKRGGTSGGPRTNSRAGWSDSSQVSSPERDNETFNSGDSGQGDSRSMTPVDVPVTNPAATILPVHVYPLPQQMRVAFSAARTSNLAPGTLDQPIVFDLLLNNLGETFDLQLGRFNCPVNGTYVFIFHMLKLAVNVPLYVNLMKNEEVLVSAYANDGAPDHETASNHAILQLFQGDQIWLRLHRGAIYGSSWKYSTFSGYLLYQD
ncbi:caprin-2 isoform X4 [Canis lupus baileyi]|uniref:caprin-2 isoform X3 n=1 Tax=Canis lupus familiaris TaxID=9615 RepID=UPI000BAA033E|nr:caprin-2 isoform X3 [Canis lupus familiaris]XP_038294548.1 caprin-2 isoform X3 [Canis lupus familiaris]XP_038433101.1 caprin-2 isoform X3 [Canis lupus familiaris]|eukprot:XP_022267055.1 caprin-2 isoform X4 [Canis lupus familiaris]